MDTLHGVMLLAWSEYKNNRIPGKRTVLYYRWSHSNDHRPPDLLPNGDENGNRPWTV